MAYHLSSAGKLALLALLAQTTFAQDDNPCKAFGKDFLDGGDYFQNSLSSDPFTFVTDFEGIYSRIEVIWTQMLINYRLLAGHCS